MLNLDLSKQAAAFIDALPQKQQRQLWKRLDGLCADPYPTQSQKLKGYDFYRLKAGSFRVVYDVTGETLGVVLIELRNDDEVYKELKRRFG